MEYLAGTGNFENCINRVNIEATGNNIGGICGGESAEAITNCKNYGTIKGVSFVGGLTSGLAKIINSQNYGTIKGTSHIGGISGRYAEVKDCQNYGEIGEETSNMVGGIIGQTTNGLINKCTNYGKVKGKEQVGGIAGNFLSGRMINCINIGDINATNFKVGGIVGYASDFYAIINCCNSGNVKGNARAGGIIGELKYIQNDYNLDGKVINCYNTGKVEAGEYKGGIVGVKDGYGTHHIENCYWKEELNLECGENIGTGNGILEITNSREYKEQEMKSDTFLQVLNNYVETYNAGDKAYSNGAELLMWKFDEETLYPAF